MNTFVKITLTTNPSSETRYLNNIYCVVSNLIRISSNGFVIFYLSVQLALSFYSFVIGFHNVTLIFSMGITMSGLQVARGIFLQIYFYFFFGKLKICIWHNFREYLKRFCEDRVVTSNNWIGRLYKINFL